MDIGNDLIRNLTIIRRGNNRDSKLRVDPDDYNEVDSAVGAPVNVSI